MTGIVSQQGHKLLAIGGMPDHVHVLVSMNPIQASSDLIFHIKRSSSLWINEQKLIMGKFSWQEGFGAFSYGKSQVSSVTKYIEAQEEHHKKHSFMEEYKKFLKLFNVEYDEKYIFKPIT
jgi:REP element-mobilizing transposase RayT